jgi:hypothetical protein
MIRATYLNTIKTLFLMGLSLGHSSSSSLVVLVEALNIPLPGGRFIRYNSDSGVLRINLEGDTNINSLSSFAEMIPPPNTKASTEILVAIQIQPTALKGDGAFFATGSTSTGPCVLTKHTFLGFYEGDIIQSREELERRYKTTQNMNMNHVMSLDGGVTFLDGRGMAEDKSRFTPAHLNHAEKGTPECNCLRLLRQDDDLDSSTGTGSDLCSIVAFFTARDISVGEELCIDYGADFWRGRENEKKV